MALFKDDENVQALQKALDDAESKVAGITKELRCVERKLERARWTVKKDKVKSMEREVNELKKDLSAAICERDSRWNLLLSYDPYEHPDVLDSYAEAPSDELLFFDPVHDGCILRHIPPVLEYNNIAMDEDEWHEPFWHYRV